MKLFVKLPLVRLALGSVISLALCSCASNERRYVSERYGVTSEKLPLIEGKWCNTSKEEGVPTLWERLAAVWDRTKSKEKSHGNSVVALEMPDERTLHAILITDGVETSELSFKIKPRKSWIELPPQNFAHPLLWYAFWGLTTRDVALGIDANERLCVNTVDNGVFMIFFMPTFIGGGGGSGTVYLYERAEKSLGPQISDQKLDVGSEP